jgi:acid-sensing ion channel, other
MGSADESFLLCVHIGIENCLKMLKQVVTESGVCFVYNSYEIYRYNDETNDGDWTLEGGYRNSTDDNDIHPRRGSKSTLKLEMIVGQKMVDGICKDAIQGFKIYLHLPNEAPQISKHFFMMPYYYHTQVMIIPKVYRTDPELRNFPVEKRQCFFSDERYLRFFKHYTKNNCEIECLVNLTLSRCGCLMFHMPGKLLVNDLIDKIGYKILEK